MTLNHHCWLLLFYCSFPIMTIAFAPMCRFETRRPSIDVMELPTASSQQHCDSTKFHISTRLFSSSPSNQDKDSTNSNEQQPPSQQDRLTQLGYSPNEIERSKASLPKVKVSVTEFEVDPVTITALGFGLIAMNFLIFANMGSGGIAGILARIINTWDN